MSAPCSTQYRFPACFTTTQWRTLRIFCPNRFASWQPSTKISRRSKNRARMPGGCLPSVRCWIAGLANALPGESVELFNCGINGESDKGFDLYRWFLPLLRMDTVPNLVQLIKLVQAEVGMGNPRVRPPRLELVGSELEQNKKIICDALHSRPRPVSAYALPNRK